MKSLFLMLFFMTVGFSQEQHMNRNDFLGIWDLKWLESGFFPDDDLLFSRKTTKYSNYVFEFKDNGTLLHHRSPNMTCMVGEFSLTTGNWQYENNIMTLELKGAIMADYNFWYILSYRVEKNKKKMWLKLEKQIKHKRF